MTCGHQLVPVSGMTTHGYISLTVEIWWVRYHNCPMPVLTDHSINGPWGERLNNLEKAIFYLQADQRLVRQLALQLERTPDKAREVVNG